MSNFGNGERSDLDRILSPQEVSDYGVTISIPMDIKDDGVAREIRRNMDKIRMKIVENVAKEI